MAAESVCSGCRSIFRPSRVGWQVLFLTFLWILDKGQAGMDSAGCTAVKDAYGSKGYNRKEVPSTMISGEHLRICPQGFTCCTQEMEETLHKESLREFGKVMGEKLGMLSKLFVSRTAKFDAFFTELLENSKTDLHNLFVKTYGLLYQQNSHVFMDLFNDLKSYYKGKGVNLQDALDGFFTKLLQKMFELLNQQYQFSEKYLQCVTEHMDDLQPFGGIPKKLSVQVKRSFVAARTFVQGLGVGRDVILAVAKLEASHSCSRAWTKMLYCPYCRGFPTAKPCNKYCMNVMKGCLAYHADLNEQWNKYVGALLKVAERLEGPFNIESVVDPIDVKISEAIMNFQENGDEVSGKIFQGCGRPSLNRKKRDATETWNAPSKGSTGSMEARPTTAAGTSLDRLVRDIKKKVEVARDFWKSMPHTICNQHAAPVEDTTRCWNGLTESTYMPEVMRDGVMYQINNPEVDVDVRKPSVVIDQQILVLKLITGKLHNAYLGRDVDFEDEDNSDEHSGSGMGDEETSGSGSGFYPGNNGFSFSPDNRGPPDVRTNRPPKSGNPKYNHEIGAAVSHRVYSSVLITVFSVLLILKSVWHCC